MIDIPLLDTGRGKNLADPFLSDTVLQAAGIVLRGGEVISIGTAESAVFFGQDGDIISQ